METAFESELYFTQAEFAEWVAAHTRDVARYELLNGRIVMNPPSGWPQGEASAIVPAVLREFVRARGLGRVFGADQGFELPSGDTVAPDTAFVSSARWTAGAPHAPGKFLRVVPDLVVEILSPTTASRDRGEKKAIYERNGVAEYWLLDVLAARLSRFDLADGRFGSPVTFEAGEIVESRVLEGFRIALSELTP